MHKIERAGEGTLQAVRSPGSQIVAENRRNVRLYRKGKKQ